MTHDLKIAPIWYDDVANCKKNFEIRKGDRNFNIGNTLLLREWYHGKYTGRQILRKVEYIYYGDGTYGISPDYVILGLDRPQKIATDSVYIHNVGVLNL